jgi:hypothetical protein
LLKNEPINSKGSDFLAKVKRKPKKSVIMYCNKNAMLKKLLYLLLFVTGFSIASHAQSIVVTPPSDTLLVDTTITDGQSTLAFDIYTLNNTTDTLQMRWKTLLNSIPRTWKISFCDPVTCWTVSRLAIGSTYPLYPGQNGDFKLDITTYCLADSPTLSILTWAPADSANTARILTWKMEISNQNCTGAAGIADITTAQIAIYPNPVHSGMKVSLPGSVNNAQIDIYNMLGSKVYTQSIDNSKEIDVSSLETGLYVARISEGGRILATRKFTKAE